MSAHWPRASEGAVGVTLLRVREGVVFHFIIPGLHMERGWTIPGEMSKHTYDDSVPKHISIRPVGVGVGITVCIKAALRLPRVLFNKTTCIHMKPNSK